MIKNLTWSILANDIPAKYRPRYSEISSLSSFNQLDSVWTKNESADWPREVKFNTPRLLFNTGSGFCSSTTSNPALSEVALAWYFTEIQHFISKNFEICQESPKYKIPKNQSSILTQKCLPNKDAKLWGVRCKKTHLWSIWKHPIHVGGQFCRILFCPVQICGVREVDAAKTNRFNF